jgi:hypothetical protein
MHMKRKTDALTGLVLAVFALAMLVVVIPAQIPGSSDPSSLPPAFMANLTMGVVLGLSLLLTLRALWKGKPEPGPVVTASGLRWLAFTAGSLALSGVLIHFLGFWWGGMLVVGGFMRCMGLRRPAVILPVAAGTAGLCYGVLKFVLKAL